MGGVGRGWCGTSADPAYVTQLHKWADEDPDMVRRYIDTLARSHSHAVLLALGDSDFWDVWNAVGTLLRADTCPDRYIRTVTGSRLPDDDLDEIGELMQPDIGCCAGRNRWAPRHWQPHAY